MSEKKVLLRIKGSKESRPFEPSHAKTLLAYPNTQWEEVADKVPTSKAPAAAGTKKPAIKPLPEVDTTGHPTSI